MKRRQLGTWATLAVTMGSLWWLGSPRPIPAGSRPAPGEATPAATPPSNIGSKSPGESSAQTVVVAGSPSAPASSASHPGPAPAGLSLTRPVDELWKQVPTEPAFVRFHAWADDYLAANPTRRTALEAEGLELARERRIELKEMIVSHPERALELTVPLAVRRSLPESVTAELEERISTRGDFEVLGATPVFEANGEMAANFQPLIRQVRVGDRRIAASVFGLRLGEPTQLDVGLHGIALDGTMALAEAPFRPLEAVEVTEALARRGDQGAPDPICSISGRDALAPTTATGSADRPTDPGATLAEADSAVTAVDDGETVRWFCGTGHAQLAAAQTRAVGGSDSSYELLADGNLRPLSAKTEGQKRLLVLRVDFSDQVGAPLTDTQATNLVNGLHQFYRDSSYGKAGFRALGEGSLVTATLRVPRTSAAYGQLGDSGPPTLRNEARAAAAAAGVTLGNYDYDLICIKSVSGFKWAGLGYVGQPGAWIQNSFSSPGVSAHELGHNFGLNHANFWDTAGQSILGSGSSVEYGDGFDTMGNATAGIRHFNARYKNLLDWLPSTSVRTLTTNGTYRLYPMDVTNANTEIRALRIARNTRTNYWFEFRQLYSSAPSSMNGLGIRWAQSGNQSSLLLDTTPGSADGSKDAPLLIGRTFSDPAIGLHVTPVGFGGTTPQSLDVVVYRGAFTNNQRPTVTIAAAATAAVNTSVRFTATASDPDGDTLAYGWDFGDGGFGSNSSEVQHLFTAAGEYVVRCEVTDMKGGVTSDFAVIRVGSPNTLRIAGRVTHEGRPLDGVRVSTSNTKQTFTRADGTYVLTGLARGTYTLTARQEGFLFSRSGFSNPLNLTANRTDADFLGSDPGDLQIITLVALGAEWRYWDTGSLPGSTWTASNFNDASWKQGAAKLGYGDPDVVTIVDFGPEINNKRPTTWFRSTFTVEDPNQFLTATFGLLRDDGAVVYLNGKEEFRSNMPTGTILPTTLASSNVNADESTIFEYDLDPKKLVTGRNVLAVEVHQSGPTSSDLRFALQLTALIQPTPVAPSLSLKTADGTIRLSWPVSATGFTLVSSPEASGPWEPIGETILTSSGENVAVIPVTESSRLFRLMKP